MTQIHFNYILALRAGYKFNICDIDNREYTQLSNWGKFDFPDVRMTRDSAETDLTLLHRKALVSVNGYIYPTKVIGSELYIPNATHSMLRSHENHIGILSFNKLANDITKIQITEDMITPDGTTSLYNKAIITFSEDIGVSMLVVAGYLLLEDNVSVYRVAPNAIAIRLDVLNYIEKLYELNKYRDIFNDLGLTTSNNNDSLIDGLIVRDDVTIRKFLSLDNSFLVKLPVTTLQTNKIYLEHSNVPGSFRSEVDPNMPMFAGFGKMVEYTKVKYHDKKYLINAVDAIYNNYVFSKLPASMCAVYNNHRVPDSTYRITESYFVDIFTDV